MQVVSERKKSLSVPGETRPVGLLYGENPNLRSTNRTSLLPHPFTIIFKRQTRSSPSESDGGGETTPRARGGEIIPFATEILSIRDRGGRGHHSGGHLLRIRRSKGKAESTCSPKHKQIESQRKNAPS